MLKTRVNTNSSDQKEEQMSISQHSDNKLMSSAVPLLHISRHIIQIGNKTRKYTRRTAEMVRLRLVLAYVITSPRLGCL